ncbi:solute carrier family 26 protein [Flavobacteriaceae bacterium]|nr:solute carrier family 26 protein [Flavobacteriaceae bacterium]
MIKHFINKYIPISVWLMSYQKQWLKHDILAGLVVGIVLIPQGMAYALIAGIPPIYGLYTALVPPLIYAIFGSARQISPGPVAMDSLLVLTGVSVIAELGTDYYLEVVFILTALVGLIQFALGFFRLGFLVNFLSKPVISGFTSAAALVIGLNQVKHLFGLNLPNSSSIYVLFTELFNSIKNLDVYTTIIGLGSVGIILLMKKYIAKFPSALIVVVGGILLIHFFPNLFKSVKIVGAIPAGLPDFHIPVWDWELVKKLLPAGFTLAMLGFLELIAIAKSQESTQEDYQVRSNQEFVALGFVNMVSSMFSGYVLASSFSRSAINFENGAKTPLSNIVSSLFMGIVLLFLTSLFFELPIAVLASIIIVAVFNLVKYKEAIRLWRGSKRDFWMWVITFVFTSTMGIVEGVSVGVIVSLLVLLARSTNPHYAILGRISGTNYFRNISRFEGVEINPEILIMRFDSELYFANTNFFNEHLDKQAHKKGKQLKLVILDFESVNGMDSSSADALKQRIKYYDSRHVKMYFTNVKGPVRDTMTRFGIIADLGNDHFFMSIAGAVDYFETGEKGIKDDLLPYINQANQYKV